MWDKNQKNIKTPILQWCKGDTISIPELDEYVKGEKERGFLKSQIKDELLKAGWKENNIMESLNKYFPEKGKTETISRRIDVGTEKASKFKKFLLFDEAIDKMYKIGFYNALLTNKRFILYKPFPKNFFEVDYKDIEIVEYYTIVKWKSLIIAIVTAFLSFFILKQHDFMWRIITQYAPSFAEVFEISILGMNIIFVLFTVLFILYSTFHTINFIFSLIGRFRVLPYNQGPIDIITRMSTKLTELINEINRIKEFSK